MLDVKLVTYTMCTIKNNIDAKTCAKKPGVPFFAMDEYIYVLLGLQDLLTKAH